MEQMVTKLRVCVCYLSLKFLDLLVGFIQFLAQAGILARSTCGSRLQDVETKPQPVGVFSECVMNFVG